MTIISYRICAILIMCAVFIPLLSPVFFIYNALPSTHSLDGWYYCMEKVNKGDGLIQHIRNKGRDRILSKQALLVSSLIHSTSILAHQLVPLFQTHLSCGTISIDRLLRTMWNVLDTHDAHAKATTMLQEGNYLERICFSYSILHCYAWRRLETYDEYYITAVISIMNDIMIMIFMIIIAIAIIAIVVILLFDIHHKILAH